MLKRTVGRCYEYTGNANSIKYERNTDCFIRQYSVNVENPYNNYMTKKTFILINFFRSLFLFLEYYAVGIYRIVSASRNFSLL
jgi:hypothetical protein